MITETQGSIAAWATETFGPANSMDRILVRAIKEAAELLDAVTMPPGPSVDIAFEAADVTLVLCRGAELCGRDLITPMLSQEYALGNPVAMAGRAGSLLTTAFEFVTAREADKLVMRDVQDWHNDTRVSGYITLVMHSLGRCAAGATADPLALGKFVDRKMKANRTGTFTRDGTGHGYRVKDGAVAL